MILGIVVVGFAFTIIWFIFWTLNIIDKQHRFDMENTYKIFLKRADQRACIYVYDIQPKFDSALVYYDTPAGTLHTSLTPMEYWRRSFYKEQVDNYFATKKSLLKIPKGYHGKRST